MSGYNRSNQYMAMEGKPPLTLIPRDYGTGECSHCWMLFHKVSRNHRYCKRACKLAGPTPRPVDLPALAERVLGVAGL